MNYVKTQRKQTESFWKNHQWFVQAFESGIMDHNLTIKSDLIGGIALFTGRGLLLSSDVAQVVAAIGAILATATAYVQRIDATLLLGISLGFRVIDFNRRDFFDIVTKHPSMEVSGSCNGSPQQVLLRRDSDEYHLVATDLRRS
jgi:hypothetical protein